VNRPARADVTASYDLSVAGYIRRWSEVILPPAQEVVAALRLAPRSLVLDVGGGTGALVPALRACAPDVRVVAFDASRGMLRAGRDRTRVDAVLADAQVLPVRDDAADAVLLAYVLFHLEDPDRAVAEAARVLRLGARVGTVTWQSDHGLRAFATWDRLLSDAGAPPVPPRGVHEGLDSSEAIDALLRRGGFEPERIWPRQLRAHWTAETYLDYALSTGMNQLRLAQVDRDTRATVIAEAREQFGTLPADDFAWSGTVLCAIGARR